MCTNSGISEVVLETQVLVSKILRGSARNPTLGLHAVPLETAVRTWDWLQAESRLWRPDSHWQWRNQSRTMEANHAQGGATYITSGNTRDWREGNTYYIQYSYVCDMPCTSALSVAGISSLDNGMDLLSRNFFKTILQPTSCLHYLVAPFSRCLIIVSPRGSLKIPQGWR